MISAALDGLVRRAMGDGSRRGRAPLALFGIFVLPVMLAAGVSGAMTWRAMTQTALSRRQAIASLAAITLKERMDRLLDLGLSLATRVQFRKLAAAGKWEEASAIMEKVPHDFPVVERILFVDVRGILRADTPALPGMRGKDASAKDWFKAVSAAWTPYVSEAYRRVAEPRMNVAAIAVPILSPENVPAGMLVLQVRLDKLLAWSRDVQAGGGEVLFVTDQHGHGASHPDFSGDQDVPDLSGLEPVRRALGGGRGLVTYDGRIAAYCPVEKHGWGVIVEQAASKTFHARNRAVGGLLLFFAATALLNGLLAGVVLSNGRRLREQGDLLKAILDSAGEGVVVTDMDGRFTLWNPAATRLVGLGAASIPKDQLSRHYGVFLPDKTTPFPPDRLALMRALKGESTDDEEEFVRNPGHPDGIWLSVTARPLRNAKGNIIGGVATFRDMTLQKQTDASLRESEERFRTVVGSAGDGIISADDGGRVVYINRSAEALFGRPEGEMIGRPLTDLMPERFRKGHEAGFARFLAGGEARVVGRTVELAGLRKDGTEFPIELSLSSWKIGERHFFTAVIRDVTARKRAEDEIKELNRHLQDQALALTASNKELESFSYSVSHDLRAPLRGIDGFSQAILEDEGEKLSPDGRLNLERVRTATQRMGVLIDNMLDLSRVLRKELVREDVDMSALALDVVEELRRSSPGRAVEIVLQEGLRAEGDKALMRSVLENLLGNAWKFTAKVASPRVEFGMRPGSPAVFFVKDNGAGFDMAYIGKLFGVFQRLHAATDFPGTGVGLATVMRIVQRHGGRVWAESGVGKGAAFYFTFSEDKGVA